MVGAEQVLNVWFWFSFNTIVMRLTWNLFLSCEASIHIIVLMHNNRAKLRDSPCTALVLLCTTTLYIRLWFGIWILPIYTYIQNIFCCNVEIFVCWHHSQWICWRILLVCFCLFFSLVDFYSSLIIPNNTDLCLSSPTFNPHRCYTEPLNHNRCYQAWSKHEYVPLQTLQKLC